jgi:predicted Zn-dependent protease
MTRKEQIEEMLREQPDEPELRYMLAMEYVSAGQDAEAVRVFHDLLMRNPDYPPGFHQAARALVRLDRIDEAREILVRGIPVATRQGNLHAAGEMQELLNSLE